MRTSTRPSATALLMTLALPAAGLGSDVPDRQKLAPAAALPDDRAATALATSSEWALVASPAADEERGEVHVFRLVGREWQEQETWRPAGLEPGDRSGSSVAIDGTWAAIGMPFARGRLPTSGSVACYRYSGGEWEEQTRWSHSSSQRGDEFGTSVAISDRWAVVGAPARRVSGAEEAGVAVVFELRGKRWRQRETLSRTDAQDGDRFGTSVGIDQGRIVVGAPGRDGGSGVASTFVRTSSGWVLEQDLEGAELGPEEFGACVGVVNSQVVVGAPGSSGERGAVYSFRPWLGDWILSQRIRTNDRRPGERFGQCLDLTTSAMLVGKPQDDQQGPAAGSAYLYYWNGRVWQQNRKCIATDALRADHLGSSVALGQEALVGAPGSGSDDTGAAYAFSIEPMHLLGVPRDPEIGQPCQLNLSAGMPHGLAFLAIVAIDGDAYFETLVYDKLDQYGTYTYPMVFPPGFEGVEVSFLGVGELEPGLYGISNYEDIEPRD